MSAITLRPASAAAVRALLAGLDAPKTDTSGGLSSLDDLLAGAECYHVDDEAGQVGAFALVRERMTGGDIVWIRAGRAVRSPVDLTATIVPAIENAARASGAAAVHIQTRRRGLVSKLAQQGYQVRGIILGKTL
ncbi:hypothetical protein [Rhodocyclus gracilis]|uniref:Uncharacterized protein n=1 Tax=Rhodocyclus tenuis TaxID=1066 RepID=A0A6L5JW41_RHOTE|nr:hypothetical protein [Rhodocyclus gracilis]MQY50834.1 hypothetical protein [Rhodocyclus gracilis]